jgi:hypothetical protein
MYIPYLEKEYTYNQSKYEVFLRVQLQAKITYLLPASTLSNFDIKMFFLQVHLLLGEKRTTRQGATKSHARDKHFLHTK